MTMNFPRPRGVPLSDAGERRGRPRGDRVVLAAGAGGSKSRLFAWTVVGIAAIYGLSKAGATVLIAIIGGLVALVALGVLVCLWSMNNTSHP